MECQLRCMLPVNSARGNDWTAEGTIIVESKRHGIFFHRFRVVTRPSILIIMTNTVMVIDNVVT